LATISDAHGRRGRWIDMLHDFSFKILHWPGMKHTNVDALSWNDALPSHEVKPSWRSHKVKLRNQDLVARSRLPTLEKGRVSSWEPRD
jgi:hypothetical protein